MNDDTNSASLIGEIGEALYGSGWRNALADQLGVSDRTLRRWIADPESIPSGALDDIAGLLIEKIAEISALLLDARNQALQRKESSREIF